MNDYEHDLVYEAAIHGYDSGDVASGEFGWEDVISREKAQDKETYSQDPEDDWDYIPL